MDENVRVVATFEVLPKSLQHAIHVALTSIFDDPSSVRVWCPSRRTCHLQIALAEKCTARLQDDTFVLVLLRLFASSLRAWNVVSAPPLHH